MITGVQNLLRSLLTYGDPHQTGSKESSCRRTHILHMRESLHILTRKYQAEFRVHRLNPISIVVYFQV